jgi:hypothetical protein
MRRRGHQRNYFVLFPSSVISVGIGIAELMALSGWVAQLGAAKPIESQRHRFQLARILLTVAIPFAGAQMLNSMLFWYRQDRVRLRCLSLILIDAVTVALCLGSVLVTGRRVPGTYTWNPSIETIKITPAALWIAVTQLGVHVVTVAAWRWLIPAHIRLPNHHRPTADSSTGWLRIFQRWRESPPQPGDSGQELTSLLPLERLFRNHETTWKAIRQASQTRLNDKVRCRRPRPVPHYLRVITRALEQICPPYHQQQVRS